MAVAPDAGEVASSLVDDVGNQVLSAVVAIAPIAVSFVLAIAAIGLVMRRFGMSGSGAVGDGMGAYNNQRSSYDDDAMMDELSSYDQRDRGGCCGCGSAHNLRKLQGDWFCRPCAVESGALDYHREQQAGRR